MVVLFCIYACSMLMASIIYWNRRWHWTIYYPVFNTIFVVLFIYIWCHRKVIGFKARRELKATMRRSAKIFGDINL